MNRQIRIVSIIAAVMVFALLGNLTYFTLVQQPTLEEKTTNRRARDAEFGIDRGQILAGDLVIADSVPSTDGSSFDYQRVYANGPLYAPITGYYSYIYGQTRLESSYNDYLSGSDSSQWIDRLVDMASGKTPEGSSVVTSIDPVLQEAAWKALSGYTGAIVALDPATGAVRAMVSTPSFDPASLATHDITAQQDAWTALTSDPANPATDRGTREIYPPGSTFKLVVASAALEAGYTPDSLIDTPARLTLPGSSSTLGNLANCGDSQVTMEFALQNSCNTSFANLGVALGEDAISAQAAKFGFGEPHLSEVGGVASRFPTGLSEAELMLSSIGQFDTAASALQMAMVAGAIANGGQLAEPYLVDQVISPDLSTLYQHETTTSMALTPDSAQAMRQMMIAVVQSGGSSGANIPGVTMGGKTGTAQTTAGKSPYAWYVGWADDPGIAICVFVQSSNGSNEDLFGSSTAAPIGKQMIQASR